MAVYTTKKEEYHALSKMHIDNTIRNAVKTLNNGFARGLNEHAAILTNVSGLATPYVFAYRGHGDISINIRERAQQCVITPDEMLADLNTRLESVLIHYNLPYTLTVIPNRNIFGIVYGLQLIEVGAIDRADELVQVMAI